MKTSIEKMPLLYAAHCKSSYIAIYHNRSTLVYKTIFAILIANAHLV